jgi:hypothetical protein
MKLVIDDLVDIVTNDEFNGHVGKITMINPVAGHEGYEVYDYDAGVYITLDSGEVEKLSGCVQKLQS